MRVLLTGASGFVGAGVVERLRSDFDLTLVAGPRAPINAGSRALRWVQHDLRRPEPLVDLVRNHDAVVHLAGLAHVRRKGPEDNWQRFFESNVDMTGRLAEAAAQVGVRRFVMMSSIAVNGLRTDGRPFSEADVPAPASHYGLSKQRGEEALRTVCAGSEMTWVALRPPVIVGAHAPGSIRSVLNAIASGVPLPFSGIQNRRSYMGLRNFADIVALTLQHPAAANQIFMVADPPSLSTPEMIALLAAQMGRAARLFPVPLGLIKGLLACVGRTDSLRPLWETLEVDASKARKVLGWRPERSLDFALGEAAAAFRAGSR